MTDTPIDRNADAYRARIRELALHGRGINCAMDGAAMPHNPTTINVSLSLFKTEKKAE